jgi:uncharacterized protein GlcG (DUF336 family)
MAFNLATAQLIIGKALDHARAAKFKPLVVVVLDARGAVMAAASEDGSSLKRFDIALAKGKGTLALNMGSRAIEKLAKDRPHFFAGAMHAIGDAIPTAGGVLLRNSDGAVIGAVGVSGDTADNDEAAALAGIAATGLTGDGG